jgi:hypothetical protein
MPAFLTRSSIQQFAPRPAQLPFAQFGGNRTNLPTGIPSVPALGGGTGITGPTPIQNPFSPGERGFLDNLNDDFALGGGGGAVPRGPQR